jgi:hypothetical protein
MSTWVYFACLDHDPPLRADQESGQHNEWEPMRTLLAERDSLLDLVHADVLDAYGLNDRWTSNGLRFFQQHPRCRLACVDEYGRWTDLGHGVPGGATLNDRNVLTNKGNLG